jgi:hypothetical protein
VQRAAQKRTRSARQHAAQRDAGGVFSLQARYRLGIRRCAFITRRAACRVRARCVLQPQTLPTCAAAFAAHAAAAARRLMASQQSPVAAEQRAPPPAVHAAPGAHDGSMAGCTAVDGAAAAKQEAERAPAAPPKRKKKGGSRNAADAGAAASGSSGAATAEDSALVLVAQARSCADVVAVLRDHAALARVQVAGCKYLANSMLTQVQRGEVNEGVAAGAVELAVAAQRAHAADGELQFWCLAIFQAACGDAESVARLTYAGAIESTVAAMHAIPHRPTLQEAACSLLVKLTQDDPFACAPAAADERPAGALARASAAGAIEAVARALRLHYKLVNPKILHGGLEAC